MRDPGGVLLPLAVAALAIFFAMVIFRVGLTYLFSASLERLVHDLFSLANDEDNEQLAAVLVALIAMIPTTFIESFIVSGVTVFCLKVARGSRPSLEEVFEGAPFFLPMLGAKVLFMFAVGAGVMFCVIPGLFLAMALALYAPILVDRRTGAIEALRGSWALFQESPGNFVFLWLLLVGVGLLGVFACCVGFVIVSMPMFWLASTVAYLKATRQSIELY